jgi:hypothetical protein
MARISLDGLVGAVSRLLITAAVKMAQRQRVIGRKAPGIEWAEPDPALGPFDCALSLAIGVDDADRAEAE